MESVSSTQANANSGALSQAIGNANVNKDQFLTLLTTQLRNQDPFEPTRNEEFLAQLATFSQLEESQAQSSLLSGLVELQSAQLVLGGLSQGASLVGKHVTYLDPESGEEMQGLVTSVTFDSSGVLLEVGGRQVSSGQIISVSAEPGTGSNGSGSGSGSNGGTTDPGTVPDSRSGTVEQPGQPQLGPEPEA